MEGIRHVVNLRTRRVGNTIIIDITTRMDGKITLSEAHDKVCEAERHLRKEFGKDTIISIHMEPIAKRVC